MDTNGNGNRLREFREGKRWTQDQLGHRAGIAPRTVSRIEQGAHKPMWATKKVLADALSIPVDVVFPEEVSA